MSVTRTRDVPIPRRLTGPSVARHEMPSGRTVVLDSNTEEIRVVGIDGDLEVAIRLTEDGPRLTMRAASLALDAQESVAVRCREFHVDAEDGVRLSTRGEVRVKSAADTHIDADHVQLNCGDRTGYHDDPINPVSE